MKLLPAKLAYIQEGLLNLLNQEKLVDVYLDPYHQENVDFVFGNIRNTQAWSISSAFDDSLGFENSGSLFHDGNYSVLTFALGKQEHGQGQMLQTLVENLDEAITEKSKTKPELGLIRYAHRLNTRHVAQLTKLLTPPVESQPANGGPSPYIDADERAAEKPFGKLEDAIDAIRDAVNAHVNPYTLHYTKDIIAENLPVIQVALEEVKEQKSKTLHALDDARKFVEYAAVFKNLSRTQGDIAKGA